MPLIFFSFFLILPFSFPSLLTSFFFLLFLYLFLFFFFFLRQVRFKIILFSLTSQRRLLVGFFSFLFIYLFTTRSYTSWTVLRSGTSLFKETCQGRSGWLILSVSLLPFMFIYICAYIYIFLLLILFNNTYTPPYERLIPSFFSFFVFYFFFL